FFRQTFGVAVYTQLRRRTERKRCSQASSEPALALAAIRRNGNPCPNAQHKQSSKDSIKCISCCLAQVTIFTMACCLGESTANCSGSVGHGNAGRRSGIE